MIAVVLPTRGMVFTEVEEAIELERRRTPLWVFRSHDMEIPAGHNGLVRLALSDAINQWDRFTHIWMIEEDTVPPPMALTALLREQAAIACIDYGVNGYSCTTREKKSNQILWCGLGCTLIKREVFEAVGFPYFRTDKSLRLNDWQWIDNPSPVAYGGLDIWFCVRARELGFAIKQVPKLECKHLKLESLGVAEQNRGLHRIGRKPQITTQQWYTMPEPEPMLTINGHSVMLKDIGNHPHAN